MPEIQLKAILLKKSLIIRWVVIAAITWRMEAVDKQTPPAFAIAKIDWSIHGQYPFFLQPFFCGIKKQIGSLLVIDAFEKTATTYRKLVPLEGLVTVKCGDATDVTACVVAEQPPSTTAGVMAGIGGGIEYLVHVAIERPDVMRIIRV